MKNHIKLKTVGSAHTPAADHCRTAGYAADLHDQVQAGATPPAPLFPLRTCAERLNCILVQLMTWGRARDTRALVALNRLQKETPRNPYKIRLSGENVSSLGLTYM